MKIAETKRKALACWHQEAEGCDVSTLGGHDWGRWLECIRGRRSSAATGQTATERAAGLARELRRERRRCVFQLVCWTVLVLPVIGVLTAVGWALISFGWHACPWWYCQAAWVGEITIFVLVAACWWWREQISLSQAWLVAYDFPGRQPVEVLDWSRALMRGHAVDFTRWCLSAPRREASFRRLWRAYYYVALTGQR